MTSAQTNISPAQYQQTVDDCMDAKRKGRNSDAGRLAEQAGGYAKQLGMGAQDVPFSSPALAQRWCAGYDRPTTPQQNPEQKP